jgi:ABC-type Fe3+/spermidine/putrescine transport system ATPase subunit
MQSIKVTDTIILSVKGLSKKYANGKDTILKDISLTAKQGEFIVIHGESGSGKSTLLHLLAGFDKADSGAIHYKRISVR